MYECICIYMYLCTYVYEHIYIHIYISVCISDTCISSFMYVYLNMHLPKIFFYTRTQTFQHVVSLTNKKKFILQVLLHGLGFRV